MRTARVRRLTLAIAAAALFAGACSSSGEQAVDAIAETPSGPTTSVAEPAAGPTSTTILEDTPGDLVFPAAEWAAADPAEMGIDEEGLAALVAEAEATGSTCLLVTRNGRMVGESAFSIDLGQQYEPGTEWEYNNSAIQTLETVLERALDEPDVAGWGRANLSEPIGMTNSTWLTDDAGNALTFMGIESTCRDMACYGLLWLADGEWDGERIISSEYIDAALQPVPTNKSYGYLWWQHDPEGSDLRWPSSPDTYAAMGLGGQFVSVDPDTGLVVSRQALNNDGSSGGLINLAGTRAPADA